MNKPVIQEILRKPSVKRYTKFININIIYEIEIAELQSFIPSRTESSLKVLKIKRESGQHIDGKDITKKLL
jgi:hypothetical protein